MHASDFDHSQRRGTGILLTNLGTPDAPTASALRRYLREFLWDRRVVEIPRPLWWLILHGIILRVRPAKSAAKYATVWTAQGSPLLAISRQQAAGVQARLQRLPGPVTVAVGMRYGSPSIASALHELRATGVQRLLILPLYPQYSATTTASTFDAVAAELKTWRWLPELRMVMHYHDDPGYLDAVAARIRAAWAEQPAGDKLLFSFHGLPKRNLLAGDPYHCECHKTARLIAERLQLPPERWQVAFQSRFGRAEWLKPYTSETLEHWGKTGVGRVDVVCPGFAADCLETLEEIAMENRAVFLHAGGKQYRYIPALNDEANHLDALTNLILTHTQGWPELDNTVPVATDYTQTQQRATALGAPR